MRTSPTRCRSRACVNWCFAQLTPLAVLLDDPMTRPYAALWLRALPLTLVTISTAAAQSALPRSSPERQGIASAAILSFIDRADSQIDAMHSFMLVRHGHVVAAAC